jgi:hypothetical protein
MRVVAKAFIHVAVAVCAAVAAMSIMSGSAVAGTYYVYSCSDYGNSAPAFTALTGGSNWDTPNECPFGRTLEINQFSPVENGKGSAWLAYSPSPAIGIIGATTSPNTPLVDCMLHTDGFEAHYAWSSGGSQSINPPYGCSPGSLAGGTGIDQTFAPSSWFGWGVTCTSSSCNSQANRRILGVQGIRLTAQEDTGPALQAVPASNLYYASGWVRGSWPITLDASDPSGVCSLLVGMDSKFINTWADPAPDASRFTQCHGSQLPGQLNTTDYANGSHTFAYGAYNAAAVPASASKTVSIDNGPVSLSLSGPTDVPSTAGTQYVHATASAGPSGVGGIFCSVDGASYQRFAGASAQVPVSGVGPHGVSCFAQNSAVDPSGAPATSPTQTWAMTIREPTVALATFVKVAGRLRCHRVRKRVYVPGRWVVVVIHHHRVRARLRGHWKTVGVTRCHRPRLIARPARHVSFGHGTTVSGWLGLANGTALGGQQVRLYATPDDGHNHYTPFATVSAAPNGVWSARVPAGPSRLIVAVYSGSSMTEPVASSPVRVIVPAKLTLKIRPRHTHWGGTISISGRVLGGYIPVGKFLRLRIGVVGVRETVGIPSVDPDGRFHTTFRFGPGTGSVRFWLAVSTLREADYPYAPAGSRRVTVAVG